MNKHKKHSVIIQQLLVCYKGDENMATLKEKLDQEGNFVSMSCQDRILKHLSLQELTARSSKPKVRGADRNKVNAWTERCHLCNMGLKAYHPYKKALLMSKLCR